MAKQFSILATGIDLQQLQQSLEALGNVDILADVATDDLHDLRPLENLDIPLQRIGYDSLFCYLAPRQLPRKVVAERDSPIKIHIDLNESNLVEFWRPFYDGHTFREGRVYYQNKVWRNGQAIGKDEAFCEWADRIMGTVRKAFKLDRELRAYVGSDAATEIASGRVTIAN
jgi:hypothetical protein